MKQRKATTVQVRSEKCLTEERQLLNRWTEFCSKPYNHKASGDPSVLNCPQTDTEDDHPILCKEIEAAVQLLKKGRQLAGPSRWRGCNHRSHNLQQDLADRRMANPVDPVLSHHTSQKGNLQQCHNYRTIRFNSHPSKVMPKIILNRLKPQAEKIIAEEQAGFNL